jgi:hypothetical protein
MSLRHVLAALVLVTVSPAHAEDCRTDAGALPDLPKGTITQAKAPFIKGACNADPTAPDCALDSYLVDGDTVFLGPERGHLRCVGYLGAGGSYSEGWIAAEAIKAW